MCKTKKIISFSLAMIMILISNFGLSANAETEVYLEIDSSTIGVGETTGVAAMADGNYISVAWSSSDSSIATVNQSGTVTGISGGTASIIADPDDSISQYTYAIDVTVTDSTGIVLGAQYYIMSANSEKLLALQSASNSHGTPIVTSSRTNSSTKRWIVEESSTQGSYNIVSAYSSTDYCMALYNYDFCLFSSSTVPFSKFKISRSSAQNYEGLYLISNDGQYLASNSSGQTYVSNTVNADCYWSFIRNQRREADFYNNLYTYLYGVEQITKTFDTTENNDLFESTFSDLGYYTYINQNASAAGAYNCLRESDDIFIYYGHGSPAAIVFTTTNEQITGSIAAHFSIVASVSGNEHFISSCQSNELSSLRCVLYLGCNTGSNFYTGAGDCHNLVKATFDKGAHFVLGITETTYTDDIDRWLEFFLSSIKSGNNIEDALNYAEENIGSVTIRYTKNGTNNEYTKEIDYFPAYSKGDRNQYL